MVSTRLAAYPHHLEFAGTVAEDVRRHLDRMGRMRGLATVRMASDGRYQIALTDMESVKPGFLAELGLPLADALDVIDGLYAYEPDKMAAVLVIERNPIDGILFSFLTLEWGRPMETV